eukprot:645281-Alexandrium_andersonii.AAC.1
MQSARLLLREVPPCQMSLPVSTWGPGRLSNLGFMLRAAHKGQRRRLRVKTASSALNSLKQL